MHAGLLAMAVVAAASPSAAAEERASYPFSLSIAPECDEPDTEAGLRREIALACDASGVDCPVVAEAKRHVRLRCGEASSLEIADEAGSQELSLRGRDRLRSAALWIARIATESWIPRASSPEVAPPAAPAPAIAVETETAPRDRTRVEVTSGAAGPMPRGVLLSERTTLLGGGFGPMVGGRVAGALRLLGRNVAAVAAASGGHTVSGPSGYAYAEGRVSGGISWGAPWSTAPVGIALEGGAAVASVSAPSGITPGAMVFPRAYVEAALSTQLRGDRALRPFASLSACLESGARSVLDAGAVEGSVVAFEAALDVGVAWRSF